MKPNHCIFFGLLGFSSFLAFTANGADPNWTTSINRHVEFHSTELNRYRAPGEEYDETIKIDWFVDPSYAATGLIEIEQDVFPTHWKYWLDGLETWKMIDDYTNSPAVRNVWENGVLTFTGDPDWIPVFWGTEKVDSIDLGHKVFESIGELTLDFGGNVGWSYVYEITPTASDYFNLNPVSVAGGQLGATTIPSYGKVFSPVADLTTGVDATVRLTHSGYKYEVELAKMRLGNWGTSVGVSGIFTGGIIDPDYASACYTNKTSPNGVGYDSATLCMLYETYGALAGTPHVVSVGSEQVLTIPVYFKARGFNHAAFRGTGWSWEQDARGFTDFYRPGANHITPIDSKSFSISAPPSGGNDTSGFSDNSPDAEDRVYTADAPGLLLTSDILVWAPQNTVFAHRAEYRLWLTWNEGIVSDAYSWKFDLTIKKTSVAGLSPITYALKKATVQSGSGVTQLTVNEAQQY